MSEAGSLKVEYVPAGELRPFAGNPRKHPDEAIGKLVKSIEHFGWTNPVLVDKDGRVLAGHARLKAAEKAGLTSVPVIRLPLSGKDAELYVIADNKTQELTEWDWPKLGDMFGALDDGDIDLELSGFDLAEIEGLVNGLDCASGKEEDEVPEPPAVPITQPGDLWLLGKHRVLCGDSTRAEDVERVMGGEKAELCITSPPYNLGNNHHTATKKTQAYADNLEEEKYQLEQASLLELVASVVEGDCFYNHKHRIKNGVWIDPALWIERGLWSIKQEVVWINGGPNMDPCRFYPQTERVFWLTKQGSSTQLENVEHLTDWWQIQPVGADGEHTRAYPVEIPRRLLVASKAQSVFDPFLGSGTTLIAAEQLGRKCYGIEISPAYCDVIVKRWENHTGKKATREVA